MGTNFYWKHDAPQVQTIELPTGKSMDSPRVDRDDPTIHIGKRSAAGLYCYDCMITLCRGGSSKVHYGRGHDKEWYDKCPQCGKAPIKEDLSSSAGGVELGFAKTREKQPSGVRSTSSFSWAQDGDKVIEICEKRPDDKIIVDEYDREFTGREFLEMLNANCMLRFFGSIGKVFC